MNAIRATQALNKRELENAVPPSASWHVDYRDTAYIYIGGLPLDLSEGDVVTIFSQYGSPTHLNMIRDKETGKSKGFAFLKYEDQRSCDLAVDNLGGAEVLGRMLRVDHTRYKKKDDEDEDTYRIDKQEAEAMQVTGGKRASDTEDESNDERRKREKRKLLKEEKELEEMLAIKQDGEDEDPMKDFLIQEKRDEVARARRREDDREKRHKHRHHRHGDSAGDHQKHRSRHRRDHDDNNNDEDKRRKGREKTDRAGEGERGDDYRSRRSEATERSDTHRRRHRSRSADAHNSRRKDHSQDRDRHRNRSRERSERSGRKEYDSDGDRRR